MNILVPDKWLRQFLKTTATPEELQKYLSLSGPSIERINKVSGEVVYDLEVTTNRPDSMSILGVAREAAVILPRNGIRASLINDPYLINPSKIVKSFANIIDNGSTSSPLSIKTDPQLNPRWTSVVLENVSVKPSPAWLQELLTLTGIRPINNIVDITNYLMRAFGQPAHAFDYDKIAKNKKGIPAMILRESKKGEKITTLDGKTHTLAGADIVIEDGAGRLIDLCGIMGGQNSAIEDKTSTIVLFLQTYDPAHIRKTSMAISHRTDAATLFEKGLDSELVLPAMCEGIKLVEELSGASVASKIYDIYPIPFAPYAILATKKKLFQYLGTTIKDSELLELLKTLGFIVKITKTNVMVVVPSFRRDITLDVDIIEEVARIFGYGQIAAELPTSPELPRREDLILTLESDLKIRLRDWGLSEIYTYSMISDELMDIFTLNKTEAYQITNPLSSEWVYMRPSLIPSMLSCLAQNLRTRAELKLFELSNIYLYRKNDLPIEQPILLIAKTGEKFYEVKGLAQTIGELYGLKIDERETAHLYFEIGKTLALGDFVTIGVVKRELLQKIGIKTAVTMAEFTLSSIVKNQQGIRQFHPIPKYPPVIEDFTFITEPQTKIGALIKAIKDVSPLIVEVKLITLYENTATFTVNYLNPEKELTKTEVEEVRKKIIETVLTEFNGQLKSQV